NSVTDQPDHALRAAACAQGVMRVTDPISARHPGWPRFRIGLNSGPVALGMVGTAARRSFASIGDTTNLAARLSGVGEPGQVVIGPETHRQLAGAIPAEPLGPVSVKGKREPVEAWRLAAAAPELATG
ncbi:MAG TPA: adenylate/guanylate cyclase domain-containing protein, partial [Gemmatimonadales bacterium]|nr:adenylate/guanylate cyclase domain-containing protein [Gemmatimonadales bacterium]